MSVGRSGGAHVELGTDPGSTPNPPIWSGEKISTCALSHRRHLQLTPQTCACAVSESAERSCQGQRRQSTSFRFAFTFLHPKSIFISRDLEHVYTFCLSKMSRGSKISSQRKQERAAAVRCEPLPKQPLFCLEAADRLGAHIGALG